MGVGMVTLGCVWKNKKSGLKFLPSRMIVVIMENNYADILVIRTL